MEKHIIYQGENIHYTVEGQGEVLVLLHGFMEDSGMWKEHSSALSKQYKVVSVDLPGHGKTGIWPNNHSMEWMAEIVSVVLDAEKVTSCVMIGHSMGGYVTLAFAEKYKEKLLGFGLFHSHSLADTEEAKTNRVRTIQLVKQNKTSFINQFIPDLFAKSNREPLKDKIENQLKQANEMKPEGITGALEAMKNRPMRLDVVAFSKVPVLFILGKQDSRIPLDKGLAQASTAKNAEIIVLGNAAHMGWAEETERTISALEGFMKYCLI